MGVEGVGSFFQGVLGIGSLARFWPGGYVFRPFNFGFFPGLFPRTPDSVAPPVAVHGMRNPVISHDIGAILGHIAKRRGVGSRPNKPKKKTVEAEMNPTRNFLFIRKRYLHPFPVAN